MFSGPQNDYKNILRRKFQPQKMERKKSRFREWLCGEMWKPIKRIQCGVLLPKIDGKKRRPNNVRLLCVVFVLVVVVFVFEESSTDKTSTEFHALRKRTLYCGFTNESRAIILSHTRIHERCTFTTTTPISILLHTLYVYVLLAASVRRAHSITHCAVQPFSLLMNERNERCPSIAPSTIIWTSFSLNRKPQRKDVTSSATMELSPSHNEKRKWTAIKISTKMIRILLRYGIIWSFFLFHFIRNFLHRILAFAFLVSFVARIHVEWRQISGAEVVEKGSWDRSFHLSIAAMQKQILRGSILFAQFSKHITFVWVSSPRLIMPLQIMFSPPQTETDELRPCDRAFCIFVSSHHLRQQQSNHININ